MAQSEALVETERADRYGKQLASHLGRRNSAEWQDETGSGWVDLGAGRLELSSREGHLALVLTGPAEDLERLEDVVGRHLVRFATKDKLLVQWVRDGGSEGLRHESGTPA